jgi:hypothetical protein
MVRPSVTLTLCLALAAAAGAQPVLPPERPPSQPSAPANNPNQPPNPARPGQGRPQTPESVPVFQPGADENFVLVQRDGAGELIPLEDSADVAAVWHVPMTEEEKETVRQLVEKRRAIFDAGVIRRFDRALEMVRARGEEPVTVVGSITNQELGDAIARLHGPMNDYNRRGTLLNDPDLREWMPLDPHLKEFGRVYRGWQGAWIAQEQAKLREAIAEGAPVEASMLMPGALDHVRLMLEFEQKVRRSLYRQYRAGEEGFFDDARSLDLSSEQRAAIDRIESVDDVDDVTRFLRVAVLLSDDQNRELIQKRNPETWQAMLLPPKLIEVPAEVQPELPRLDGDGIEFALVSYDAEGRLERLDEEPDLAALRALDLPQDTRRTVERIVGDREAVFDIIIVDLAEELHWLCATADVEGMTDLELLVNHEHVLDQIRAMGSLMRPYYTRGDLLHDSEIKETLTDEQHAEMSAIYDNFARAYLAQVAAEVEAGRAAGLEIREPDVRETAAIHVLRMKDFVRKARQRLAHFAGIEETDLIEHIRTGADLPADALAAIEPKLAELEQAEGAEGVELFWDILTTLTPQQAMRILKPRLARHQAPANG